MKTSRGDLSDSDYYRVADLYKEKHKEDMEEVYKQCKKQETQQRKSWWKKIKSLFRI